MRLGRRLRDHSPVELKLAKFWVCRVPLGAPCCLRRPSWVALRGFIEAVQVARSALATKLN